MPPKFRNDHGVPEIQIGVKELSCVGVSAPHDHPHIYLNMGGAEFIKIVPYCAGSGAGQQAGAHRLERLETWHRI